MTSVQPRSAELADGDACIVIGGTHKDKSGIVRDLHLSKSGILTITVVQSSGERFKTLAKNVAKTDSRNMPSQT